MELCPLSLLTLLCLRLCQGLRCLNARDPCANGGTCLSLQNGTDACRCDSGFVGERCQFPDPCLPGRCRNGGTCAALLRPSSAGFSCACLPGFTGEECQGMLGDACFPQPCRNGGTCQRFSSTEYQCKCLPGWTGKNCQQMDFCSVNRCANGGKCINTYPDFVCQCPPGYEGEACERDIDECQGDPSPCHNGGACLNRVGSYECSCPSGFSGSGCEFQLGFCTPAMCPNGGTCRQIGRGLFECVCSPGFTGPQCEQNVDDCLGHLCKNHGECVDGIRTYTCRCPEQWTGWDCSQDVDECRALGPRACQNGGTCHNLPGGFRCVCVNGWTGGACHENIDDCLSATCHQGSTCIDLVGTFSCQCPPGKTGGLVSVPRAACRGRGHTLVSLQIEQIFRLLLKISVERNIYEFHLIFESPIPDGAPQSLSKIELGSCVCVVSAERARCEVDIDDCDPLTDPVTLEPRCFHGGTCSDKIGGHSCQCPPGYVGERCEGDVNECLSNPCDARGAQGCLQLVNAYQCECRQGYTGARCESVTDSCKVNPCSNGGTCAVTVNTPLGFTCRCLPGFDGATCSHTLPGCGGRHCYNGGVCDNLRASPRCVCPGGFTGPECRAPWAGGCGQKPCRHNGSCSETPAEPFFRCACRPGFAGPLCQFPVWEGGPGQGRPPPAPEGGSAECAALAGSGVCEPRCSTHQTGWDGGDCSLQNPDPWKQCGESSCWSVFRDGVCQERCNTEECFYDGHDCIAFGDCNPLYHQYCQDHFGNGHCEWGCNSAECGWDGGDCARESRGPRETLVLLAALRPGSLRRDVAALLRALARALRAALWVKRDGQGEMIYRCPACGDLENRTALQRWQEPQAGRSLRAAASSEEPEDGGQTERFVVFLEVDLSLCTDPDLPCLKSAEQMVRFLAALAAAEALEKLLPFPLVAVKQEHNEKNSFTSAEPPWKLISSSVAVGLAVVLGILIGVHLSRRRKREHGALWFPAGFARHRDPNARRRREPVGEDAIGLKPLKQDTDCDEESEVYSGPEDEGIPAPRKLKLEEGSSVPDRRRWTQKHIKAGVHVPKAPALTPPQGEPEGRDIDARGPDGVTPLMSAVCAGGGLEANEGEEAVLEGSATVIADLIVQGASLDAQKDSTGETALHLAARFSRADAAKSMLDAGANTNLQDKLGRTPLHTAIAADALGVFQILIRCRQTDVDARMQDGSTPLILATRLAVENMVEELISCGADVNATDGRGKSALHWAAAVNNLRASHALLRNGANKDLQDGREQTPLFLAAREGSHETARLLLEHRASREIPDHVGCLPRDAAHERLHHDILYLLDDHGLSRGAGTSPPGEPGPGGYPALRTPAAPQKKSRRQHLRNPAHVDCEKPGAGLGGAPGKSAVAPLPPPPPQIDLSQSYYLHEPVSPSLRSPTLPTSPLLGLHPLDRRYYQSGPGPAPHHQAPACFSFGGQCGSMTPNDACHQLLGARSSSFSGSISGGPWPNRSCEWVALGQHRAREGSIHSCGHHGVHYCGPALPPGQGLGGSVDSHCSLPNVASYASGPTRRYHRQGPHPGGPHGGLQGQPLHEIPQAGGQRQPGVPQFCDPAAGVSPTELSAPSYPLEPEKGAGSFPTGKDQAGGSQDTSLYLTPPSQHSYPSPPGVDQAPFSRTRHPFLTPSPESRDQWSSASPHSNKSDWSEGAASPSTTAGDVK
ncbi:neurogenic locus notch homolog protein 1-like [Rhinatrema bivittatum]|uniref:neurogenic locus notch homolog protein 1-like n=1 Tax=Rhinatrema bivittatum TaxID=194408 RepID=UPI0011289443|nr:neurogenic locus notch homolog protein 1-like [Rhinatrema bivittatum]